MRPPRVRKRELKIKSKGDAEVPAKAGRETGDARAAQKWARDQQSSSVLNPMRAVVSAPAQCVSSPRSYVGACASLTVHVALLLGLC